MPYSDYAGREVEDLEGDAMRAEARPQSPACYRCTQGVMDSENPHLWGECRCPCHPEARYDAPAGAGYQVEAERG